MDEAAMNSLVLAYLGDAVFELEVRKYLVGQGLTKVKDLHREAINLVRATTQAKIIHLLWPDLTEEEQAVVKRGRNSKSGTAPKNTDIIDYRYATAFEALIGYWYLLGSHDKINQALNLVKLVHQQKQD